MALKWKVVGYAAAAVGVGLAARAAADQVFTRYPSVYYQLRSPRLLTEFENAIDVARPIMMERFGSAKASQYRTEARAEFRRLIPKFPYIGPDSPLIFHLVSAGWVLSVYRVLDRHGYTLEEIGGLLVEFARLYVEQAPQELRKGLGQAMFTPLGRLSVWAVAFRSQHQRYPGDFVMSFVSGDGSSFDFGITYHQCALVKFLESQGAAELSPYMCAVDRVFSEAFGWGLIRTQSIGEGANTCDFRFKKGGMTQVESKVMPADQPPVIIHDPHPELFEE